MKQTKFQGEIKKIGNGFYILIPSTVRKLLGLKELDLIELDIKKVTEIGTYKCEYCGHVFPNDNEIAYCPVCEKTECLVRLE